MGSSIRLEGDIRILMLKLRHLSELDKKGIAAAMKEAARTSTLDRFREEKDPEGKPWKTSIRAASEGGKTLSKTARLKNSIRAKSDASGFAVGTNTIYAATHQLGEKGRKITIRAKTSKGLVFKIGDRWIRKKQVTVNIKIPARPFLGFSDEDLAEIKGTLEDALEEI